MAIKEGDLLIGKLGNKIYSIDPVTKQQVVRSLPKKVGNPKTEAQQKHRNAFVEIVRLSSYMTEAHTIGLHRHAQKQHKRTYADFRSLNKDCFTAEGSIDYPHVIISYGSVAKVMFTSAKLDKINVLCLSFDPHFNTSHSNPDDELYLFAYCPACNAGCMFEPVQRVAATISIELPPEWPSNHLHLYAFLRDRKGNTSNTIYIPLVSTML